MNQELTQEQITAIQNAQAMWENWDLRTKSRDEQKTLLTEDVIAKITKVALGRDMVEEIYVMEDLQPLVAEALQEAVLPESYPDKDNVGRDKLNEHFSIYCKAILVRPASIDMLAVPVAENPNDQFIKYLTAGRKKTMYLDWWADNLGLGEYYEQNGIPFRPDYAQIEQLLHTSALLECIARKQAEEMMTAQNAQKIEMATAGNIKI